MKLASLRQGRDGALAVVSHDGTRLASATDIAPTLQAALDDWSRVEPLLRARSRELEAGNISGLRTADLDFAAPLPRAYEWIDGSAFINHIVLVRRAWHTASRDADD